MSSKPIYPITLEQLQVFPLPRSIELLPEAIIFEFARTAELLNGHLQSLSSYKTFSQEVVDRVETIIETYEKTIELIGEYDALAVHIKSQLTELQQLYRDFTNSQVIQYQLLANNYNLDYLIKVKFKNIIDLNSNESIDLVKQFHRDVDSSDKFELDLNKFVSDFKTSRSQYHLRKEKLNRWNEERVSGAL